MHASETNPGEISWTVAVAVSDVQDARLRVAIEANEAERAEIARVAGLRELQRLAAEFELTALGGGEVRAEGRVCAVVGQTCVVTLEPVENAIEEPVNLLFTPSAAITESTIDEQHDSLAEDPPEPIIDGKIDLAKTAVEFLILGIDPYPRKPGAAFEPILAPPDPAEHPFAGLAALKEPKSKGGPAKPPRKRS